MRPIWRVTVAAAAGSNRSGGWGGGLLANPAAEERLKITISALSLSAQLYVWCMDRWAVYFRLSVKKYNTVSSVFPTTEIGAPRTAREKCDKLENSTNTNFPYLMISGQKASYWTTSNERWRRRRHCPKSAFCLNRPERRREMTMRVFIASCKLRGKSLPRRMQ